jgi:xanthine dehydrogenase molybdenum-binding subunit
MKVKERLLEFAGRLMAEHAYNLEVACNDELQQGVVQVKHFPQKFMTIGDIAKQAQIMSWGTIAYTDSYRQRNCPPCFTTHFVEVDVDTRTGVITIPKVLIYGDCGVAMNPDLVKGQLIGSFNRGFGYTVMETLPLNEQTGELMNKGLLVDYKTPTAAEMPKLENIEVVLCDTYEPSGPFGAKGIGEAALASVQAAIANAIYNAVGIRFDKLPITPEVMLEALKKKEQEAAKQ